MPAGSGLDHPDLSQRRPRGMRCATPDIDHPRLMRCPNCFNSHHPIHHYLKSRRLLHWRRRIPVCQETLWHAGDISRGRFSYEESGSQFGSAVGERTSSLQKAKSSGCVKAKYLAPGSSTLRNAWPFASWKIGSRRSTILLIVLRRQSVSVPLPTSGKRRCWCNTTQARRKRIVADSVSTFYPSWAM
jgi:hypothetical protein